MSATVRARTGCTCSRPWFSCLCPVEETVYEASGHPWTIEDTPIPTPAFVAKVARLHPGASLVYIDGPAHLATQYRMARAGVEAETDHGHRNDVWMDGGVYHEGNRTYRAVPLP